MKHIRLFIPCLCLFITFIACKKDDKPDPLVDLSNTTWTDSANISGLALKPVTIIFNGDGTTKLTFPGFGPYYGTWNKTPNSNIVDFFFSESPTITWKAHGTLSDNNKINKLETHEHLVQKLFLLFNNHS